MSAAPSELWRLGAYEIWRAIQRGESSVEDVTAALLARIRTRDSSVRAWDHIDEQDALAQARRIDRRSSTSWFHGVPVGVKDVLDIKGLPTRGGAPEVTSAVPARQDARAVANVRAASGVLLGKTASARYGMMFPAATRNPHNHAHTPGASSSGSAAAVADFMVPVAIGTQTAGSLLRPAAYCGVVGFKPSHNAVPSAGMLGLSDRLDTIGCLSRSVKDTWLLFDAMSGREHTPGVASSSDSALTVGVFAHPLMASAEDYVQNQFERARSTLAAGRTRLVDIDLRDVFDESGRLQDLIARRDTRRRFAPHGFGIGSTLDPQLIEYCTVADSISDSDYASALTEAADLTRRMESLTADVDLVLMPATLGEAPLADSTGTSEMLRPWTLWGNPTISLPFGKSPSGLPLAIQLAGHRHNDARFLGHAMQIERLLADAG